MELCVFLCDKITVGRKEKFGDRKYISVFEKMLVI